MKTYLALIILREVCTNVISSTPCKKHFNAFAKVHILQMKNLSPRD